MNTLVFCEGLDRTCEIICRIGDVFRRKCLLILQGVLCCRACRDTADRGSDAIHIDIALLVSIVANAYKSVDNIEGIAVFLCIRLIGSCPVAEKMPAVSEESVVCPVCGGGADTHHSDPVDKKHDCRKNRKAQPTVGDNPVDLVRGRHFADSVLFITGFNELRDIVITLIGDDALCVVIKFRLGGLNIFFDMRESILRNIEVLQNFLVSLKNLDRIPALLFFRKVVYNGFLDMRNRVLDGSGECVLRNGFVLLSSFNCALRCLHYAASLQCGDPHHAASQLFREALRIDLIAVLLDKITHIHCQDHRNAELYQLCCQVKIPLQISAVDDIEDCVRPLLDQIIAGDDFLQCIRGQRINTGKVRDDHSVVFLQLSFLLFHCDAGPVSDKLIGSCQCIEQCCLTAVRISGKSNSYCHLCCFLSFLLHFIFSIYYLASVITFLLFHFCYFISCYWSHRDQ